jgi:hypothetical protein
MGKISLLRIRVVALVAVLSGLYRHSQRMVKTAMEEIFDIRLRLGTINKLRMEASTFQLRSLWSRLKAWNQQIMLLNVLSVLR